MIPEEELENLKIKPIAKKKEDINIELNSQGSNYIIDETKEKKINKSDFFSKIKKGSKSPQTPNQSFIKFSASRK